MQDLDRVDEIMGYLISYVTKNVIPFVRSNGGWVSLALLISPNDAYQACAKICFMSFQWSILLTL